MHLCISVKLHSASESLAVASGRQLIVLDVTLLRPVEKSVRRVGTWNGHATPEQRLLVRYQKVCYDTRGVAEDNVELTLFHAAKVTQSRLFLSFLCFSNRSERQEMSTAWPSPLQSRSRPDGSGVRTPSAAS
jgi:hypothetical protein